MKIKILTIDEVLRIYDILIEDFANSDDPISPPGIRSLDLLESAIARQQTAIGGTLKYPEPIQNASTLLYGICNNHPFHNGNKRTALVSMLVHLDKNKLTIYNTSQKELYKFIMDVANHTLGEGRDPRRKNTRVKNSDEEMRRIVKWLSSRVSRVVRGEKNITYRQLRKILKSFGYDFGNPHNNFIDIISEQEKIGIFGRKKIIRKKMGNIPYPGENRDVAVRCIKYVRKICYLQEEDGVDSDSFYNYTEVVSVFVNRYRKLLCSLAYT